MQSTTEHKEQAGQVIKTVIKLQLIVVSIATMIIAVNYPYMVKSTIYGGMIAILNTGFLYWRMQKSNRQIVTTPEENLKVVYRSGIERFVLTGCLLAIGMSSALKLSPLVMLISFIIGQLVFLLGAVAVRTGKNNIK